MDDITFELVLARLRRIPSRRNLDLVTVRRDPMRENGLIYDTAFGVLHGKVWEEDGSFVFRFGTRELLIPINAFLGRPQA